MNICVICGKQINQTQERNRRRCASCNTKIRRYRNKRKAVELLGGRCVRCGWTGNIAAFEFHHVEGKDFTIGQAANKSWEVVKKEVLKCELLCSNCHRIEHSNNGDPVLLQEVDKYRGRLLD